MNRLFLIDGHSMAYRAFYALPIKNFQISTGQHTNAVHSFVSMLIGLLIVRKPSHVAIAFDVGRESFRNEAYLEYKATRSASPQEFRGQMELIKEILDGLRISHVELPGYEADDIIATMATRAEAAGYEVLISTGDRDALQLVTDHITVLYPRKGVSDMVQMTPAVVEEKYLVPPQRYPELAAFAGETSDNLPGVPSVGPKTAAKWINTYDGLANIIERAEQVPGEVGQSLRDHLDEMRRNRRLNRLLRDLELPLGFEQTERRDWDREVITQLFAALEFRSLKEQLSQLYGNNGDGQNETREVFIVTGRVLKPGEVVTWLEENVEGEVALSFVGVWGAGTGDLRGLDLMAAEGPEAFIDSRRLTPAGDEAMANWPADAERPKVVHDAKDPLLAIWAGGWGLDGVVLDVVLTAYLLRPDVRRRELASLVRRYLHRELVVEVAAEAQEFLLEVDEGAMAGAAMLNARAIAELARVSRPELESQSAAELLRDVGLPLQRTLANCERVGIVVNRDVLDGLRAEFDSAVVAAQQAAWDVLGHEVNLGPPKQLQAVLFKELGIPKTRHTKSGYTTNTEALEGLFERTGHPFLEHLLAHRDRIRLRQTVDGLLAVVQPDGRVHTTYVQTIAATGRLSSTDLNLQNIPIRTELGRRVRSAFVAGDGFEALMSADYSQIEIRLMAYISGDEGLIVAFRSGRDFHAEMAAIVFGVTPEEVTGWMRARVKAVNYGLAYGLGAYGLSTGLGISVAEAKELMGVHNSWVDGVQQYLAKMVAEARRMGYASILLGRRRYLPGLNSNNRQRREVAERAALNSPIQGSATDIIKLATPEVERGLIAAGLRSRMLLQVHDELVLEIFPGEREIVEELVCRETGTAMDLAVPLEVSVGVGDSWFTAAH